MQRAQATLETLIGADSPKPAAAPRDLHTQRGRVAVAVVEHLKIPARYTGKTFDAFEGHAAAVDRCRSFAQACRLHRQDGNAATVGQRFVYYRSAIDLRPQRGILLAGRPGVGKSHLSAAIAATTGAPWVHTESLYAALKASYAARDGKADALIEALRTVPVVVLDDLAATALTEWERDTVAGIVFARYDAALPTVVSTNLKSGPLADQVGERIVSRLCEACDVIKLTGPDYRQTKRGAGW